jgi:hypothetical protein
MVKSINLAPDSVNRLLQGTQDTFQVVVRLGHRLYLIQYRSAEVPKSKYSCCCLALPFRGYLYALDLAEDEQINHRK